MEIKLEKKIRNSQDRTWNVGRNTENVKNDKGTLQEMEYGEKSNKRRKWKTHMLGHEIWQETLKNVQDEKHAM